MSVYICNRTKLVWQAALNAPWHFWQNSFHSLAYSVRNRNGWDPMIFNQIWTELDKKLWITIGFFADICSIFNFFSNQRLNIKSYKFKFPMQFLFFWDPSHCVLGLDELWSHISVSNLEIWKELGSKTPLWNICSILARFWQCGFKLLRYKQNAASAKPLL